MSEEVTLSRVDPSGVEVDLAAFHVRRFALVCRDKLQASVSAKRVLYRVTDDEGETVEWGDTCPEPAPGFVGKEEVTVSRADLEAVVSGEADIHYPEWLLEIGPKAEARLRVALSEGKGKEQ